MNEIIAALYTRLTSQIVTVPVYDHVLQDTDDFPYIQFVQGPIDENDDDTQKGFVLNFKVVVHSRYRGMKEINDVVNDVYNALHQWEMPNTATYSVGILLEQRRSFHVAPDGLTRYSVQEFRTWVDLNI